MTSTKKRSRQLGTGVTCSFVMKKAGTMSSSRTIAARSTTCAGFGLAREPCASPAPSPKIGFAELQTLVQLPATRAAAHRHGAARTHSVAAIADGHLQVVEVNGLRRVPTQSIAAYVAASGGADGSRRGSE